MNKTTSKLLWSGGGYYDNFGEDFRDPLLDHSSCDEHDDDHDDYDDEEEGRRSDDDYGSFGGVAIPKNEKDRIDYTYFRGRDINNNPVFDTSHLLTPRFLGGLASVSLGGESSCAAGVAGDRAPVDYFSVGEAGGWWNRGGGVAGQVVRLEGTGVSCPRDHKEVVLINDTTNNWGVGGPNQNDDNVALPSPNATQQTMLVSTRTPLTSTFGPRAAAEAALIKSESGAGGHQELFGYNGSSGVGSTAGDVSTTWPSGGSGGQNMGGPPRQAPPPPPQPEVEEESEEMDDDHDDRQHADAGHVTPIISTVDVDVSGGQTIDFDYSVIEDNHQMSAESYDEDVIIEREEDPPSIVVDEEQGNYNGNNNSSSNGPSFSGPGLYSSYANGGGMTSDGPLDTPCGWHWGSGGGVLAPGIGAFVSGGVPATGNEEKKDDKKEGKRDKGDGISSTSIDGVINNNNNNLPIVSNNMLYPPAISHPLFDRKSYNTIGETGAGGLFGESASLPPVGSNSATTIQFLSALAGFSEGLLLGGAAAGSGGVGSADPCEALLGGDGDEAESGGRVDMLANVMGGDGLGPSWTEWSLRGLGYLCEGDQSANDNDDGSVGNEANEQPPENDEEEEEDEG